MRYLQLIAVAALVLVGYSAAVPAAGAEYGTKDEAVALVKQAIARVNEVGIDKAKPEFMDHGGKFVDRDLYLIVIDKERHTRRARPEPQAGRQDRTSTRWT